MKNDYSNKRAIKMKTYNEFSYLNKTVYYDKPMSNNKTKKKFHNLHVYWILPVSKLKRNELKTFLFLYHKIENKGKFTILYIFMYII